jgi:hypothetical protein
MEARIFLSLLVLGAVVGPGCGGGGGGGGAPAAPPSIGKGADGVVIFWQTYGGTGEGRAVRPTSDGGYIIAGGRGAGFDLATHDLYLAKTDSSGRLEWEKTYGTGTRSITGGLAFSRVASGGGSAQSFRHLASAPLASEGGGDRLALTSFSVQTSASAGGLVIGPAGATIEHGGFTRPLVASIAGSSPLTGTNADFPQSGKIDVQAADGSRIGIEVLAGEGVRLWVDTNGDGKFENKIDTAWGDLMD